MPNEQQSSLRQAVDRILGIIPGGSSGSGQAMQASDFDIGHKPGMADISNLSNLINALGTKASATNKTDAPVAAPVSAPVVSAPATGTDPNASLYSWTTPREREAAAAAAAKGIDYWGTTSPESRAAAFKSQDAYDAYKWKGQEWNDPITKQIYQQFNPTYFDPRQAYGGTLWDKMVGQAQPYAPGGSSYGKGTTYHTFINPVDWGGTYGGGNYNAMKDAYIQAGGLAYGPTSPYGK